MKIYLQVLCLLIFGVALLTACGRNNSPDIEPPAYEVSIRWGYGYGWSGADELPPDTEVVSRIGSTFGVSIIPELIQYGYDESNPPNIFVASSNPHDLLQHEVTRTIPMDMIARHAPNYYNLLMSVPFGLDAFINARNDLIGLPIYTGSVEELGHYSVYRLDWLERHNIFLPGNIVPIREGQIYFSDTPFTYDQFVEIMRAFSEPARQYGFAIVSRYGQLQNLRALKGMWGLGNGIVYDNGRPNYYFADPRYKEFLQFMAYMYGEGMFALPIQRGAEAWQYENIRLGLHQTMQTGWFQFHFAGILTDVSNVAWVFMQWPDARLLVTPPEIGHLGDSGVGVQSALPFSPFGMWVIGSQTSDEELAVVLEIFDYVTFDRYAYAMVNYGFEGEHFEWEGIPFGSRAIISTDFMTAHNSGVHVLSTLIPNPAGNLMRYGDNVLTRHSISTAGRHVILPYREDIHGDFALQYAELTERYGEDLMRIREEFFLLAIRGEIDIEAEWQSYIDELNANGLPQFLALVAHFPVVGR